MWRQLQESDDYQRLAELAVRERLKEWSSEYKSEAKECQLEPILSDRGKWRGKKK